MCVTSTAFPVRASGGHGRFTQFSTASQETFGGWALKYAYTAEMGGDAQLSLGGTSLFYVFITKEEFSGLWWGQGALGRLIIRSGGRLFKKSGEPIGSILCVSAPLLSAFVASTTFPVIKDTVKHKVFPAVTCTTLWPLFTMTEGSHVLNWSCSRTSPISLLFIVTERERVIEEIVYFNKGARLTFRHGRHVKTLNLAFYE